MDKKLQVFVSSTYTDLIEERQAAVEAILEAGHIPAGMELFKAGNDSQLKTIYKWIDESDVYMLILGGRYGSIESKSGKSYTQLEYEYALSQNIPIFSIILSENYLKTKTINTSLTQAIEQSFPEKYNEFKKIVMSKIVKFVDDSKDIKLNIINSLNYIINTMSLKGWVRYNPLYENQKVNTYSLLLLTETDDKYLYFKIKDICNNLGIDCSYPMEIFGSYITIDFVLQKIDRTNIIVADISKTGRNVYYELGYAKALNKNILLIANDEIKTNLDEFYGLREQRIFIYSSEDSFKHISQRINSFITVT